MWTGVIGAGLFGVAGVAGWMWRVEVLNRALAGNTGPWKVEIARLDRQTGGGFQLRGITVSHQGAGKPLISWEHLVLTEGMLSVVTGEPDAFGLTAGVDWEGGAATVHDDGTLITGTQTLFLTAPRIHLRAESGALAELQQRSRSRRPPWQRTPLRLLSCRAVFCLRFQTLAAIHNIPTRSSC